MKTSPSNAFPPASTAAAFRRSLNILAAGFLLSAASLSQAATTFNFTLARAGHTSAGVYNSSGKLVRTLWADALFKSSGAFSAVWDNLDDSGAAVPAGTYSIKVLAHNLNYVWEGVVGNTSDNKSGASVHACLMFATTISFSGNTGCYAVGYSEFSPAFYSFSTSAPQQLTKRFDGGGGGNPMYWNFSDADSTQVFFSCPVTQDSANWAWSLPGAVSKFNPVTGEVVNFTAGTSIWASFGPFSNGVRVGTQPSITGLAVQKNGGSLLAVSVAADNKIYLLDKVSGSVVSSFTVTAPKALAIDNADNLWVVTGTSVQQYSNLSTVPTLTATVSSGLVSPISVAVSPATATQPNLLLVTDGGSSQQVKAFNMAGTPQWTFGQADGYTSDPVVATNKFWFFNGTDEQASIAFQPDGSFWVQDAMNFRLMHYSLGATAGAQPVYQNQIAYLGATYTTTVDANNPNRVFISAGGRWLEFSIDYTKALGGTNGSWTLVKNWGHSAFVRSNPNFTPYPASGLSSVATLSNNRTYGIFSDETVNPRVRYVVELPATGNLRNTGLTTGAPGLYSDGSLRSQTNAGNVSTFSKQALSGFDAAGNPIWGALTTIAAVPGVGQVNPTYTDSKFPITSSNKLVVFDSSKANGMHLGGVDLSTSTTQWAWESAPAVGAGEVLDPQVPFWGDGTYNNFQGIQYAGASHTVSGKNIVYLFTGEFWNASEANQLMHFYDNGLFVGQFGTPNGGPTIIAEGGAGNLQTGTMVLPSNGKTYLYVNDENQHSGLHRWRFDGLTTIGELTGSGALNSTVTLTGSAPIGTAPTITGAPGAVTGLKATPGNGKVFLQWTAATNATYYQVRASTTPGSGYEIIATGQFMTNFTDKRGTNGQTYYYVVTAINGSGAGATSGEVAATPSTGANNYEAEDGTISAGLSREVNWFKASNDSVVQDFSGGTTTFNNVNGGLIAGTRGVAVRYLWPYGTPTPTLVVNGVPVSAGTFPATIGGEFGEVIVNAPLNAGATNTLVLGGLPWTDKISVLVDTPFKGTPWVIPGTGSVKVEAESYDIGGEGLAFHDTGAGAASVLRAPDAVTATVVGTTNKYRIASCAAGEWLKYTVSVPTTGAYTFAVSASSTTTGKTLHLEDELGNNLTGAMTISKTSNLDTFALNSRTINLTAGTHALKLVEDSGSYNLDYFTLSH